VARRKFRVGDGRNLFDYVYVGNFVHGLVLLAKALLKASSLPQVPESERVDGEAFQTTNDEHWFSWDFTRAVAAKLGSLVRREEIAVIPKTVGPLMAFLAEWIVWILSLGKRQSNMTVEAIRYSTITKTVNIDKTKRLLGYRPVFTMQEG
jgi:sterol-4alpha-carboxylate 3-dehydrogenase (decarboxylating)